MMGSCSLWLPLVTFLPLVGVAPVYCQHTEDYRVTFLVAMKSNGSGVEVRTLFPENHDSHGASQRPGHGLKPQMLFISGHNLSSECGEQYFRCQEVLVDTVLVQGDGGVLNIVFVPLEKGILLLHYWYDSNTLTLTTEWNIYSSDCSPIVFFKISNKVFVVCISSYQYLAVYEIQVKLSGSIIEDMIHLGPLMNVNISNLSSSLSLSNFVVFEHMIYFTVGNTIVVMDVFDSTRSHQHQTLPGCTQIYKIIPTTGVGGQQLLVAYCIHKYDYFDLQYGDWTDLYPFSSNGVPYICPDNNYRATLFTNSTLQFSVRGSILNTINNVSISSGVCFESQNKTYFAYSDQQHNYIYVYDFIAQDHYPVSPYDCSHVHQDCPQLLTLGNEYLVVRDADCNYVLDIATDFNLLINISSGITDILAIVHSNVHSAITPSPPIVHSTASEIVPQSMGFTISITTFAYDATLSRPATITLLAHSIDSSIITPTGSPDINTTAVSPGIHISLAAIISIVVVGLFVIIAIIVSVAVGFSIWQHWRSKRWNNNITFRTPKLRFITNRNSSAPLLAADVDGDQEEEEGESYEVALGVITNRPVESSMNWQGELDDSDEVKQYCNDPTYI